MKAYSKLIRAKNSLQLRKLLFEEEKFYLNIFFIPSLNNQY